MKTITDCAVRMSLLASSNDNNSSFSFSPSELWVDSDGNCFEETYSSRECAEKFGGDSFEKAGNVTEYFKSGYWAVSGDEIKARFYAFLSREKNRKAQ